MLKNARCPLSCLLTITIALTLLTRPVYARHEFKVLGGVLSTFIVVSFFCSWYYSDDFDSHVEVQRLFSDNPVSPAVGIEHFYRPGQQIIGYTLKNDQLIPHVTQIRRVELWSRFDSSATYRKSRIDQLLLHNDMDHMHWIFAHQNKSDAHFKRYIANLSAYCETGTILAQGVILAFHAPDQDQLNFRNTCREWLDRTIDKTDLLIGSESNSPVVLVPIWKIKQNKLVPEPQVYYELNPYFNLADKDIQYNDYPVSFHLQGTDDHEFVLYPLFAVFSHFRSTQLRSSPALAVPGVELNEGVMFSNFGTWGNMTAPYMLESNVDQEQYLIFRTNNQLEVWPVYGIWSPSLSPLKTRLKNGFFSLMLENRKEPSRH